MAGQNFFNGEFDVVTQLSTSRIAGLIVILGGLVVGFPPAADFERGEAGWSLSHSGLSTDGPAGLGGELAGWATSQFVSIRITNAGEALSTATVSLVIEGSPCGDVEFAVFNVSGWRTLKSRSELTFEVRAGGGSSELTNLQFLSPPCELASDPRTFFGAIGVTVDEVQRATEESKNLLGSG